MRKILFLLTIVSFFSCKKTEEKVDSPVELKNEIFLDTLQEEVLQQEVKEEVFAKNISDITVKQFTETFKNDGVVSFYFIVENDITKAEIQATAIRNLIELLRNTKYSYGLTISRNNMYRKMTINITYNDKNEVDLDTYFSEIKEILSKIHVKGVQVESE